MCGEMKLQAISGLRKGCEPLAYVTVPKDLTKIKSKMLFGLTKRQLVCFGSAALVGVPLFFLSKGSMGTTPAALCMILVMLPFFLFALYEKNGQTPEALLGHLIQCKFTRPKKRVYQTNNAYSALEKQAELERTVGRIASGAGKRGKGRRRLTRQERKQIEAVIRQAKGDGKNHTVQASLPFRNMHPDGLCRMDERHFSKTIAYADVSYRLAGPDDQRDIFERLCDFYNGYDPSIGVQMTLSSSHKAGGGDLFRMAAQGDELDGIRAEASGILQTQYERGSNGYVKSKYVTLTIEAESIQAARARFSRIEADTLNRFKVMGAAAKVLDGKERLALLHGLLHPRGEPFAFEWDWLAPSGLSVKDFIVPSSFEFGETRRFRMGEMYGAVSFLQILAPEIQDRILTDFMDVEGNLLVTMHIRGINQNEAIKMVKRKITDLDAMKIQEQKKAARSGYDLDILPSDLSTYGGAAKNLLQDLQSRNERMFNMTFLMLHLAPTKQKLEIAVSQSASVAQTHNCILTRLDFQQEDGLVSSLPLGLNRIQIERSLTTSALAVFVPFVTQELFMGGDAMYYGLNALSGNMILLDRKQSRCPNGLVFGTPGSGKSMSCKREITYVMLTTKDNVIICDPEDEYSPLVKRLGGQVIRLSPSSTDYVNPLDINLNYSEEENPLALKSDFVLSFCELIMGSKTQQALDDAAIAVLNHDLPRAAAVLDGDTDIDDLENQIDEATLNILARTQPVARDLRFLMSVVRMVLDLERIGDESVVVAEQVTLSDKPIPSIVEKDLRALCTRTSTMLRNSLLAFQNGDAPSALAVSRYDDETAQMMVNIFQKLMQAVGDRTLEPWDSMHIVLITRAPDRVCRRAENIAEHAYFMVEGVSLKHRRTLPQGWEK